jgi:hypothetical protein
MALLFAALVMAIAFAYGAKNPFRALLACVFVLPWFGISVDIGLNFKMFTGMTASLVILTFTQNPGFFEKLDYFGVLFILWAIIWSLFQIPFLDEYLNLSGGSFRSPILRSISQVIMFLLMLSPAWLIPQLVRRSEDIIAIGRSYIYSVGLLCSLGYLQLFVWFFTGRDPLPLGIVNSMLGGLGVDQMLRTGTVFYGTDAICRMSSLGGEPRHLAANLIIGLALLQSQYLINGMNFSAKLLWLMLLIGTVLTYSTSGLIAYTVTLLTTFVITFVLQPQGKKGFSHRRHSLFIFCAGILSIFFVAALVSSSKSSRSTSPLEMIYERTLGRFEKSENLYYQEDFDGPIIDFLLSDPSKIFTGVGLGNAHLYSNSFLDSRFERYAADTVMVSKRGYLRVISELGGFGLGILIIWFYLLSNSIRPLAIYPGPLQTVSWVAIALSFSTLVAYMLIVQLVSHFAICLGVMKAIWLLNSRQQPAQRKRTRLISTIRNHA